MKKQSKQQQQNKQKKAHKEGKEIPVPILYFFDTRTDLDARAETFLFFFFLSFFASQWTSRETFPATALLRLASCGLLWDSGKGASFGFSGNNVFLFFF